MSANFHDLIHGFHSFKESYFMKEREFFDALAHGQSPKTLVIACCDSRADPALLMGCKPGDLFVIRSVAAIVPSKDEAAHADAVIAAAEYAVKHLEVKHIIVMGHSGCGGIHGLMFPEKSRENPISPAGCRWQTRCLRNLRLKTPWKTRSCAPGAVKRGRCFYRLKTFCRMTGFTTRPMRGNFPCTRFTTT